MKFSVILFAFICSVTCQWTDSSWTDAEFGGVMYICFDDDEMHGAYSEYGLVIGSRSGDDIEGIWYEGGGGVESCTSGPFGWTISDNGNGFTGWWSCNDDDEEFNWSETLLGTGETITDLNCPKVSHVDTFAGSYFDDVSNTEFDICIDDEDYRGSYEYEFSGFELGVTYYSDHEEGAVGSGYWVEDDGSDGISLLFRLRSGELGNFWWGYDDNGEIDTRVDVNVSHGYDIYEFTGSASASECIDNSNLLNTGANNNNNDDSTSNATIITVTCLFVIVLAFI